MIFIFLGRVKMGIFDSYKKKSLIKNSIDLENQGKYEEALKCLDKAQKLDSEDFLYMV